MSIHIYIYIWACCFIATKAYSTTCFSSLHSLIHKSLSQPQEQTMETKIGGRTLQQTKHRERQWSLDLSAGQSNNPTGRLIKDKPPASEKSPPHGDEELEFDVGLVAVQISLSLFLLFLLWPAAVPPKSKAVCLAQNFLLQLLWPAACPNV